MSFTVVVDGAETVEAAWRAGCEQARRDIAQGAARAAQVAVRQIKADAPVRSGDLRDSVQPRLRVTKSGASGEIVVGAKYAAFVRDGTPPHLIVARSVGVGGVLRFEIAGRVLYRASVNHPGTAPNDFVSAGVQQGQQALDYAAARAVARLKERVEA